MNISGFQKEYMIYAIKCNTTNKIYIGSTSNLTSRISVHLSSFKQGVITCRSALVLQNNNYNISVLREKFKQKKKQKKQNSILLMRTAMHVLIRIDQY